jgi:nucleoid-associated protein YgaU
MGRPIFDDDDIAGFFSIAVNSTAGSAFGRGHGAWGSQGGRRRRPAKKRVVVRAKGKGKFVAKRVAPRKKPQRFFASLKPKAVAKPVRHFAAPSTAIATVYAGADAEPYAAGNAEPETPQDVPSLAPAETLHAVERQAAAEEPEHEEHEPEEPEHEEPEEPEETLEGLMSGREVMVLGDLGELAAMFTSPSETAPPDGEVPPDARFITPVIGPALAVREPERPSSGSGWPPPAKPSAAAWARDDGSYVVQRGDSVSGIAQTYLGAFARWREIWRIQSREFLGRHPTPDRIQVGDVMLMPKEAQDNARRLGVLKGLSPGGKKGLIAAGVGVGVLAAVGVGYGIYSGAIG